MSKSNLIHNDVGQSVAPTQPGEAVSSSECELTPPLEEALITRAKDVIAGRIQPPPLVAPPQIEQYLQQEFSAREQRPTAEALRRITDRFCLEAHYAGQPIACVTTPAGTLAVLASGEREIEALLRGLSEEEGAQVVVTDSEQF